jgi:hypothetical protein
MTVSTDNAWFVAALGESVKGLQPPESRTIRTPQDAVPYVLAHLFADATVQAAITDGLARAREAVIDEWGADYITEAEVLEARAAELRTLAEGPVEEEPR